MNNNNNKLNKARTNKFDEFYTQYSDIELECLKYNNFFEGKVVYCNCDNPFKSQFFRFFVINFKKLKLKKLVSTCIRQNKIQTTDLLTSETLVSGEDAPAYKAVVTNIYNIGIGDDIDFNKLFGMPENSICEIENGDFRSEECIKILQETDIVVTNPPFSLFRDFLPLMMKYDKRFLIIGNKNSISHKNIFPYYKDHRFIMSKNDTKKSAFLFIAGESYTGNYLYKDSQGRKIVSQPACWMTNLESNIKHKRQLLTKKYYGHEDEYPKYDNYDAINVDKLKDIPSDYYGLIGVPITFLLNYDPEQFEIVWIAASWVKNNTPKEILDIIKYVDYPEVHGPLVNRKVKYPRVLIKRV